jgi:predicted Zn finger-like uncharacterized protein
MFTRCPECETTFRLSAQDLRRAGGKVRCGECETVFNALEYLEEDAEQVRPANSPWTIQPANDERGEPEPDNGEHAANEAPAEILYHDDYVGPIGEPTGTHEAHPDDSPDLAADSDSTDEADDDTRAGILVTDTEDDLDGGEQDDDEDIVSFVTPSYSSAEYPEVSPAVSAAIGISQDLSTDESDASEQEADDEQTADEQADWSNEPAIDFDEEIDISMADATVDFTLSDDNDDNGDSEPEFVAGTDDDDDAGPADDDNQDDAAVDGIDEFDDTIWERIPGVGSGDAAAEDPLFVDPLPAQPEVSAAVGSQDETHDAETTGAADSADDDNAAADLTELEFNAPADTWSSIFSRATRAARAQTETSEDTRPHPVIPEEQLAAEAEELDAWSRELSAGESGDEPEQQARGDDADVADDATDWIPELGDDEAGPAQSEWLAEDSEDDGDASAPVADTELNDWVSEQEESGRAADAPQHEDVEETGSNVPAVADSAQDSDKEDSTSLTAAFASGEYDEEEYDVQHIVLADENEPDGAGLTQAFAVASGDEAPPWQPGTQEPATTGNARTLLWSVGGLLVMATLALQLIHYNRDALAGNVAWGDSIRRVYRSLGMELYPNWSLDDYEIRGSEAIAGESGPDIMDIRAQIAAIGKRPVGLPHLRVVLRDRWSNPVAAKTLGPAEYAPADNLPSDAMLQPNETLAAHVSVIDPGSGAQGFELELCLPRRHTGLQCTGRPFE